MSGLLSAHGLDDISISNQLEDSAEEVPGIIASGETAQGFYNLVKARSHQFIVDEPLSYGGGDKGPTPYEYLGAALGLVDL